MNKTISCMPALLLGAAMALPGLALANDPAMAREGVLVDSQGMTLYTYDKDTMGTSNCTEKCAENWPPLEAKAGAKGEHDWSVIKRKDGSMQWAHHGKPLYTFIQDQKAGDRKGDGKMDAWHVAKPD